MIRLPINGGDFAGGTGLPEGVGEGGCEFEGLGEKAEGAGIVEGVEADTGAIECGEHLPAGVGCGAVVFVGNGYEGVVGNVDVVLVKSLGEEKSIQGMLAARGLGGDADAAHHGKSGVGKRVHKRLGPAHGL